MSNVLLDFKEKPYQSIPFSDIKVSDYLPAVKHIIQSSKETLLRITQEKQPTFTTVCEAFEFSTLSLDRIADIFFNIYHADANPNLNDIAEEITILISNFSSDIMLNKDLFENIQEIYERKDDFELNQEQLTLVEKQYKSFVRNGALLNKKEQNRLRQIDEDLSKLSLDFETKIKHEINAYTFCVKEASRLKGLPKNFVEAAKSFAEKEGKEGFLFNLQMPSYIPFMTYIEDRDLRKELAEARAMLACSDNEYNNYENISRIIVLRQERSKLLGYDSYCDYVLEQRMAKNTKTILDFEYQLLEKVRPRALKDYQDLCMFAKHRDGIDILYSYDLSFYSEQLKQQRFNFKEDELRPYFELDKVLNGAFEVAKKLFGISFEQTDEIEVYNEEVQVYLVKKSGNTIAVFYGDYFPRAGKNPGAWMTKFSNHYIHNGNVNIPHVCNVCNFTRPNGNTPALLSFDEVTTLFHEFGHALHSILSKCVYPSLSGANTYWDFVELPSQIMENWCYETEVLEMMAKHYKTQKPLPHEKIEKLKESSKFMKGLFVLRQISLSLIDMNWHKEPINKLDSVLDYEKALTRTISVVPDAFPKGCVSASFSHIFSGGYASGYYSYKWAEVLEADAFEEFKREGVLNSTIGKKFEDSILSKGASQHPMELYRSFKGVNPTNTSYFKKIGLTINE